MSTQKSKTRKRHSKRKSRHFDRKLLSYTVAAGAGLGARAVNPEFSCSVMTRTTATLIVVLLAASGIGEDLHGLPGLLQLLLGPLPLPPVRDDLVMGLHHPLHVPERLHDLPVTGVFRDPENFVIVHMFHGITADPGPSVCVACPLADLFRILYP